LSLKTTNRMLASPELPPSVRLVVLRYVMERSDDLRSSASADWLGQSWKTKKATRKTG